MSPTELIQQDREHLIHPLYHPDDHESPVIFVKGEGAILTAIDGREYIDGLSCLWNVNIGHGRPELADAAAEQMRSLAFASNYTGSANVPAIKLATKLAEVAYPSLNAVYFTSGGAESNESAFKTARFFWKAHGRPDRVKIIARNWAYHGVTIAAMSATGMANYKRMFEPQAPGFLQINAPYRYRCQHCADQPDCNLGCANELEQAIEREGPETVAAFIAEPVQGAGGVIPPPPQYFPRIREICDQYDILFIADEVITGFGRTGRLFALDHWGVEPDIMTFAKGITSGYLPLGGMMISDRVQRAILDVPIADRWMHAYTYSGHPTCCAVGLTNLDIILDEKLADRAATMGRRMLDGLQRIADHPNVGEVRGLGMMAAVELVADKATRSPFEPSAKMGERVTHEFRQRGLFTRARGDVICLAPPLVTTEEQMDRLLAIVGQGIEVATAPARR
ncbi:MAG: aspartate aminotransferase family protein [Chloroflexi bacterium]|nr:aspartate aminotransferase family protein [Chloroflexota bacterium]